MSAPIPPKPEPIRAKEISERIAAKFPGTAVDYAKERRLKVTVPASQMEAVCTFVRDELGFDHLKTATAVDWIAKGEFEIIYFVGSLTHPGMEDFVLGVAERVPRTSPEAQSLINVWPAADYSERETHEMFGIDFRGHPSRAHLFLPEDWNDLPPLRKDYISPGR